MNRTIRPQAYPIGMPNIPQMRSHTLNNGTTIHLLIGGAHPIVRIDMAFRAGSVFAPKCGLARATSVMLGEGIPGMNAEQLAEKIDFYGAQMWQKSDTINSVVSLVSLDKHLVNVLPLIEMMIKQPTFPEKELNIYLDKEFQSFKINMSKSRYKASYEFTHNFFAEGSRYGRVMTEDSIHQITQPDLISFHQQTYGSNGLHVFVSGQPSEQSLQLIDQIFSGEWGQTVSLSDVEKPQYRHWSEQTMQFNRPGSMQASINMGRILPQLPHPDLMPLSIVNTIFGGYFGSRLMQNIREEKGLTYGIGSSINSRRTNSLMRISSDVEPNNWQLVINEIFNEMRLMREQLIDADELEMLRSYIKGQILSRYDSIMTSVDTLVPLVMEDVPFNYDQQLFNLVENITPEQIQQLAQQYLIPDQFRIVVVK